MTILLLLLVVSVVCAVLVLGACMAAGRKEEG